MFSLAEATTWSADDVLAKIRTLLNQEWKLSTEINNLVFEVVLENQDGIRQWSASGADSKLLYLDLLGWLWLRGYKPKSQAWIPRDSMVLRRPERSTSYPDVPDLDPDEIAAVYKKSR